MEVETGASCAKRVMEAKVARAARDKGLVKSKPRPSAKMVTEVKVARAAKMVTEVKVARAARDKGLVESKPRPSQEDKENDDSARKERMALSFEEANALWEKRAAEAKAAREARDKLGLPAPEPIPYEDEEDTYFAEEAREFRETWDPLDGPFEETTKIPNKRFTYIKPAPSHRASTLTTLEIFSVKVSRIRGGLQWPLQVFGIVAIRDCIDNKRNIIFNRPRDNCQVITQEVPYLKLIGPARAVLLLDPATFEVDLQVKGTTEAEDDCLSFLATTYINKSYLRAEHFTRSYPCRLSTLEFELGYMFYSVEATIDVRIISGSWPDGFRAQFAASTSSIRDAQVILLDSGDDKVQLKGYEKKITLSRCVVCVGSVETSGELRISVKALQGDSVVANENKKFKPWTAGTSDGVLRLGFCTLRFTISWSLVSPVP